MKKLCYSTLCCPEWTWNEVLATARDVGYQGVEVRGIGREVYGPRIHEFAPGRLAATRAQMASLNLALPVLDTDSILHLPQYRDRTLREVEEYLAVAVGLGASYLRILGDLPVPEPGAPVDDAHVVAVAKELAPMAEKAGVGLLLETQGAFCDTLRLRRLLDAIASPAVAALWDIHHPYRWAGEDPAQTARNLGPYIKHCHIKDSVMVAGKPKYTMLGQGDLPVKQALAALADIGFDGFYCMEWVRRWDLSMEEPGIMLSSFLPWMAKA